MTRDYQPFSVMIKMNNPQYHRLFTGEHVDGFKRVTVEYLRPGAKMWQIEPIECEDSIAISKPIGIESLPRPSLSPKARKENE